AISGRPSGPGHARVDPLAQRLRAHDLPALIQLGAVSSARNAGVTIPCGAADRRPTLASSAALARVGQVDPPRRWPARRRSIEWSIEWYLQVPAVRVRRR